MASVQQPPPPPPPSPPVTLSSGKPPPSPCPQHAAIPIPPEYPPVQETSGSSQANFSENGSSPPMQNGLQFPPSQDSAGPELSDGDEEKKHLPVQETDPAPQTLAQQSSGSRVSDEADAQAGENGEERMP
ncbi:formin-like protein 3 [Neolamprologus brichardi]|uniref:formin-like protein 3 n=1 Tax=Neolamprologus brichardi TaxID=32507 RepID=UPI0003EBED15|nr:formin-like protein 3 [Neolamprologus brichardi]